LAEEEMNSTRSSHRRSPGAEPGPPPSVPPRSMSPAVGVGTNRPVAPRSSASSRQMQAVAASGSGSRSDGTRRANVSSPFYFPCFESLRIRDVDPIRPAGSMPSRDQPKFQGVAPCYYAHSQREGQRRRTALALCAPVLVTQSSHPNGMTSC
jgi:hypothetical protein